MEKPNPEAPAQVDVREAAQAVIDFASTGSTWSEYSQQHNTTMSLVPTKLINALEKAIEIPAVAAPNTGEGLDLEKMEAWFEERLPRSVVDAISNKYGLALIAEIRRLRGTGGGT